MYEEKKKQIYATYATVYNRAGASLSFDLETACLSARAYVPV